MDVEEVYYILSTRVLRRLVWNEVDRVQDWFGGGAVSEGEAS